MSDQLASALLGSSGSSAADQLVSAYKLQQRSRVDILLNKKNQLEKKQQFYSKLNTQINSLVSQIDKFAEFDIDNIFDSGRQSEFAEKFVTRKATSSDSSYVSASADSDALLSSSTIKVNRLAGNDVLISDQLNLNDSFGLSGSFTFQMKGTDITVDLDGSETNEQAMTKIVNAVNSNDDVGAVAALVKDTTSTGRISFSASETGEENALTFSQNNDLLAQLGFDNSLNQDGDRSTVTDTKAGYRTDNAAQLDSEAIVNGITVTRSSNMLEDVLPGVSINLLKVQDEDAGEITLKTEVDRESVENLIKPFLNAYNSILSFLDENKTVMRSDTASSSLKYNLRSISSQSMDENASAGDIQYLTDIGIDISSSGKLSISDTERLQELLEDNPGDVAKLFTGEDGFASKIYNVISRLTGSGGLIQSRRESLTDQIEYNKERTEEVQSRIDAQAEILRKEYENMLEVYLEAQNQFNYLSGFSTSGTGTVDYY